MPVGEHALDRFLKAQDEAGTYRSALAELRSGSKRGHWMWFVFPQCAGLGMSATSQRYAISSLAEARAYLQHPVLGSRLRECAGALLAVKGKSAEEIFGHVDAMKLRSSMTLFALGAPDDSVFREVLGRYFNGTLDPRTEQLISES